MGKVVTFAKLSVQHAQGGAHIAAITAGDMHEMAAAFVHIVPGQHWNATVAHGSDCYLFMLEGAATIVAGKERRRMLAQSFATIQEGVTYTIENDSHAAANLVRVIAPPHPNDATSGFTGGLQVTDRGRSMVVNLPAEKKKRIYFVGPYAAKSGRGHAMIVVYESDTVTGLHYHPNAESMFVVIDGALDFVVNGQMTRVVPGQAAVFGINDRHGLRTADGVAGASFLEFHVPAAFTTVHEQAK
jgi:mannose-6-phosphate isomerase-like protein (cupin superfamily)